MATTTTTASNLHVTVITPARSVLNADAQAVVVPAFDGELGVLPGHADMLALLGSGVLRLTTPEGNVQRMAIRGGFLQVNHNKVTVLTPESASSSEIKPDALKTERDKLNAEKLTKLDERDTQALRREWLSARERTVAK